MADTILSWVRIRENQAWNPLKSRVLGFLFCFVMLMWCWKSQPVTFITQKWKMLKFLEKYGKILSWNPWQGWQPPKPAETGSPEYIGREVRNHDSLRNYFDFHWHINFVIYLWRLHCCVSYLSQQRQGQKDKKIMPTLLASGWAPLTER